MNITRNIEWRHFAYPNIVPAYYTKDPKHPAGSTQAANPQ